eukprot:gene1931-33341_t
MIMHVSTSKAVSMQWRVGLAQRRSSACARPGAVVSSGRRFPLLVVAASTQDPPSGGKETKKVDSVPKYDSTPKYDAEQKRQMEDELKDPRNFVEYLFPRPIRIFLLYGTSFAALLATSLGASALIKAGGEGSFGSVVLDAAVCALCVYLGNKEQEGGEQRVIQRKVLRDKQIKLGDREVFLNDEGEKMSRLKPVNDEWILRRLERWGKKDQMPFIGPQKAPILRQLVEDKKPKLAVEVGTMAGYSALVIAQSLPEGSKLITLEKDWMWFLVANRFKWMASATPDLQAAEQNLAPGAVVIADNAGVFKDGGMKGYLALLVHVSNHSTHFDVSPLRVPSGLLVPSLYGLPYNVLQGHARGASGGGSVWCRGPKTCCAMFWL